MKKILAIIMVLALIIAIPTGCEKKMSAEYLVWNIGADPKTFDPGLNNANDGGHIIQNLFEGLMQETEAGLKPAQAESYKISDDGLVYTFKIRKDAKWSDGKPVTAQDFVYSWQRVCSPEAASEYSFIMTPYIKGAEEFLSSGSKNITDEDIASYKALGIALTDEQFNMLKNCVEDDTHKNPVAISDEDLKAIRQAFKNAMGLKAIDEKTLEVTLNFPCSYFLNLLTFYTYMPVRQDIIEANGEGWEKNPATCIGNGPFVLEDYKIGDSLKMKKNENYYDAKNVRLAGVKGVMIVDETTGLNAYKAGDIQVQDRIPPDQIPDLLASDPNFSQQPQVGTYYGIFNCDVKPTNDIRVRKALSLAIDRKKICEEVCKGGEIPAVGFIPPNLSYSDGTSCRIVDKDGKPTPEFGMDPNKALVEEAQKLLADAGYPGGKGFPTLTYITNEGERHQKVAQALQEMWKTNLGINIEIQIEEWAIFDGTRKDGNFTLARGGWLGDYAAPMTMLDLFTSYSGNNDAQWRWNEQPTVAPHDKTLNPENKEFDDVIKTAMITSGKEQDEAYKKAEQIMMDQRIIMPILNYTFLYLIDSAKVEGVDLTLMGQWIFKNAEIIE